MTSPLRAPTRLRWLTFAIAACLALTGLMAATSAQADPQNPGSRLAVDMGAEVDALLGGDGGLHQHRRDRHALDGPSQQLLHAGGDLRRVGGLHDETDVGSLIGRKLSEKWELRFHSADRLSRKSGGSLAHLALSLEGARRQIGHLRSMSW